jgi:hypothetical protein
MAEFYITLEDGFNNYERIHYLRRKCEEKQWEYCALIFDEMQIRQPSEENNLNGIYSPKNDTLYCTSKETNFNITCIVQILKNQQNIIKIK